MDGTYVECRKNNVGAANACPSFQMLPNGNFDDPPLVNQDGSDMVVGEWNTYSSEFTVTKASLLEMHIFVSSMNAGFNYDLDDVELVPL